MPVSDAPCRLRLSPSPPPARLTGSQSSSAALHSQAAQQSAVSSPAKRRRPNDTDSEASSVAGGAIARTRISQQASASGRVSVDEVDLEGKYVRLSNKADEVRAAAGPHICTSHTRRANIPPSGPEPGQLAAEEAGRNQCSHHLQVPRQVHPEGRPEGDGEQRAQGAAPHAGLCWTLLDSACSCQIWASGAGRSPSPPTDLVWKTQASWGTGDLLHTTLISASGEVNLHFPARSKPV